MNITTTILASIIAFNILMLTKCNVVYEKPGKLIFAVYLSLCWNETTTLDSAMLIDAIDYQVGQGNYRYKWINRDREDDIVFGYRIYDTCSDEASAARTMINLADKVGLIPEGNCCISHNSTALNIYGVIANMTGHYTNLVVHSFLPTKQNFMDLSLDSPTFDLSPFYRYRSIGEGGKVFEMIKKIVSELDLRNIGMIISDSTYGRKGYTDAVNSLSSTICSLSYYFMPETEMQMGELMTILKRSYHLDAIILWLTGNQALEILRNADKYVLHNQTWISGTLVSLMPANVFQNISASVLKGMVVILPDTEDQLTREFQTEFWKLSKTTVKTQPWVYETLIRYKMDFTLDLIDTLEGSTFGILEYVMNGIYIMTNEVYSVLRRESTIPIQRLMTKVRNKALVRYNVYNVFFSINYFFLNTFQQLIEQSTNNTVWKLKTLGKFKVTTVSSVYFVFFQKSDNWKTFVDRKSPSLCNRNCLPGYHRVFTHGTCCYLCKKCDDGYFTVNSSLYNVSCVKCPDNSESNENRTHCMFYEDIFIEYDSMEAYITYSLSGLGSVLTLVSLFCFIIRVKTPVVKSSNVKLSLGQLLGHLFLFIHPVLYFGKQNEVKCSATVVAMGLLVTTIIAIVFAKTYFFLQVFNQKTVVENPILGKLFQYISIVSVLLIYGCIVVSVLNLPVDILQVTKDKATLQRNIGCGHGVLVIATISYDLLLLFICMVLAFKARNLPSYFNETKLIFYASFLSVVLITMASLLIVSTTDIKQSLLLKVGTVFSFNISMMLCLYTWKVWIIIFKPEENTKEKLRMALFSNAKENVAMKIHRKHNVEQCA